MEILSPEIYSHIHLAIKGLFPPKKAQNFPQAGRLQYFLENWEKLTSNPAILNIVKGYQIPFLSVPIQKSCPPPYLNGPSGKKFSGSGERTNVKGRCNKNCPTRSQSLPQLNICGAQKELQSSPGDKFEKSQSLHSVLPFQN